MRSAGLWDLGRAPWFRPFPGKHCTVFLVVTVIQLLILFLGVLGLSCCTLAFCSCGQRGPLLMLCPGFSLC